MATTFDAKSYAQPAVFRPGEVVMRTSGPQDFTLSAVNDKIRFFKLPVNVKIEGGKIFGEQIDAGAGGVAALKVTDGTTTKTILSGTSVQADFLESAPAQSVYADDGIGFVTDNGDYYVYFELTTGAAGAYTADGDIRAGIVYSPFLEGGESS